MNMSRYLDLFLTEAREHLSAIEENLATLEETPGDRPTLDELFRHAHSIKGMAAAMGFQPVAELAHGMEDVLDRVKQDEAAFDGEMKSVLGRGFDGVDRMISQIEAGGEPDLEIAPILERLRSMMERAPSCLRGSPSARRHNASGAPDTRSAPATGTEPFASPAGAREAVEPKLFRIQILVASDSPLPAARAAVAVKRLEGWGRVVTCVPSLPEMARREFHGHLSVLFETSHPIEKVREDVLRVPDVVSVEENAGDEAAVGSDLPPATTAPVPSEPTAAPAPAPAPAAGGALSRRSDATSIPQPCGHEQPPSSSSAASPSASAVSDAPFDPPNAASTRTDTSGPARAPARASTAEASAASTVRIPARSLDRFLDTVGELIVQRGRLAGLLKGRSDRALDLALERLRGLVDRLYGDVMGLRMIPFETIAHRFNRSVRELADSQRKKIALRITGREVLLDRSMLDELIDPINHVLRNAVDHGIERPEERIAAGKPEGASISISLERAGDSVTIRIKDDGRGMDPERIKQAALRKGFITNEAADLIGDSAALMLTTIPGFSTSDRVTDVSGRGVGMDVVRTRVETLGGRLALHSSPGAGLTVEMRLPLTIVVVQAFMVEAGGRRWVVPLTSVRRTLEIALMDVEVSGNRRWILTSGEKVPLYDLGATLGLDGEPFNLSQPRQALLASEGGRSVVFTVDRIVGRREIVVKPLHRPLEELRGYSGATILDDGGIALILDLLGLARL